MANEFEKRAAAVISGLRACLTADGCSVCPYRENSHNGFECQRELMQEALTLLQSSGAKPLEMLNRQVEEEWLIYYRRQLEAYRQAKGLTQRALAAELGVNPSAVRDWLIGKCQISPKSREAVEKLIDSWEGG